MKQIEAEILEDYISGIIARFENEDVPRFVAPLLDKLTDAIWAMVSKEDE
jgi:hypothetical protein